MDNDLTGLGTRFYYILQCKVRTLGWLDWMPDDTLKRFSFESEARAEIDECMRANVPPGIREWRIIYCTDARSLTTFYFDVDE